MLRQRRARNPLYDLNIAKRRIFWVAACAGIIVFGSLMGAMFVGQQYLQNVLGYSTVEAGQRSFPPRCSWCWSLLARRDWSSPKARGSHCSRLRVLLLGFLAMLLLWEGDSRYWQVGLAYALIGIGVGFAGTPGLPLVDGSVPVQRAGMASGTADLQRDLGGAIMQSILGALLTAGYAAAFAAAIAGARRGQGRPTASQAQLTKSFAGARRGEAVPEVRRPDHRRREGVLPPGDDWAYTAGIVAILLGAVLVFFLFPHRDSEQESLHGGYHAEDTGSPTK